MTYEELGHEINNPNPNIALFARLYASNNPPLRIGDYMNATTQYDDELNYIDLTRGIMLRRIKKNQGIPDIVPLSSEVITHLKGRPSGLIFNINVSELNGLIHKTFPDKTANPHYWRSRYSVDILPYKNNQAEILRWMDHSALTNAKYYHKADGGFLDLVINK